MASRCSRRFRTRAYDIVLLAVAHDDYRTMSSDRLRALVRPGGLFGDLKNARPQLDLAGHARRWVL